jgi:hypothetical protein
MVPTVYLDTNIISGLAKGEYEQSVAAACVEVTQLAKQGHIALLTSEVTAEELDLIPPQYKTQHLVIYNLIKNVSRQREVGRSSVASAGMGSGPLVTRGLGRSAPPRLVRELEALIQPSSNASRSRSRSRDISHLFQCASAGVDYFLTEDRRSILRHKKELRALGLNVVSSVELVGLLA